MPLLASMAAHLLARLCVTDAAIAAVAAAGATAAVSGMFVCYILHLSVSGALRAPDRHEGQAAQ